MAKAQAAAELMIILAVSLVVLIAIFSFNTKSISELNQQKQIETAHTSVTELKNAVNDVYSQGVGAKKRVFFIVPSSVNQSGSGIIDKTIVLDLLGNDVAAKSNTPISGTVPTTPGGHWVWVTAHENYVSIGSEGISIDKTSSFVTVSQSGSIQDSFTITNNGDEAAAVTITKNWPHTGTVDLETNPPESPPNEIHFNLNAGEQQTITLTYTASATASGNYSGTLGIEAVFAGSTENISFPVNAEVVPIAITLPINFSTAGNHVFTWISQNTFSGSDGRLGLNAELDRNYLNTNWNTGLIGYWKFNETGSTVLDHSQSPTAHNGTLTGGASTNTEGLWDTRAGTFNGSNQFMNVSDHTDFDMTDTLSISAWLNSNTDILLGAISDTALDSLEFDTSNGEEPSIVHVSGDIYAIAYQGTSSDGIASTITILPDGTIPDPPSNPIDSMTFESATVLEPKIFHVSGDIFGVVYEEDSSNDGWIRTFTITPTGTIGSLLSSVEFDNSNGRESDIITVPSISIGQKNFAIAYRGNQNDGFVRSLLINETTGAITLQNIFEYNTSDGYTPDIVLISEGFGFTPSVFAIAYRGEQSDGFVSTIGINLFGTITSIDGPFEFDASDSFEPSIIRVAGDVFAIAYRDNSGSGTITTLQIDSGGNISSTIDSQAFSPQVFEPDILSISGNLFAVAYRGTDDDGFISTVQIDSAGNIASTVTDTLEFDTDYGEDPFLLPVSGGVFAIAYTGNSDDGFVTTIEIVSNKGIFKTGSYGIDTDTATAYATINGQTISAPISAGWNQVVLTYDRLAGANQQKLFVNGVNTANATLTELISSTSTDFVAGSYFNGKIDEITVWNRVLNDNEIQGMYNNSFEGYFDADPLDSGANNSIWAGAIANGTIDSMTSCADLKLFGAGNSLPLLPDGTVSCIQTGVKTNLGPTIGRYMGFELVIRNNVSGNNFAAPYIDDLTLNYYLN